MRKKETVLCIKRNRLPESWVNPVSIIPIDFGDYIAQCTHAGFEFIPRSMAETNPALKQIIPYIVLQTSDYSHTAVYNRQGSEKRLHDLWSIGIGGHINPIDQSKDAASFKQVLMAGMIRELNEELACFPKTDIPSFLGVISEEKTEVGKVHLGAVFRILTDTPEQYAAGPELFQFTWRKTNQVKTLPLELWSTLALRLTEAY